MKNPQVLILSRNEFQRRTMADLARCNELTVQASGARGADDWIQRVTRGECRPSVVVIDLDEPSLEGVRRIEELRKIPVERRPRVVGLAGRTHQLLGSDGGRLDLEDVVTTPLDFGCFARSVARQALEARLAEA
ncbi:MAG: hypothetical protein KDB53_08140 [Planctomycetes bacterium]|nr:hypothetical protein [Planctomycetota bacterium]